LVHHSHPLYIHPSDTQGSIVLHGKNKLGFVLGTCRREMYDPSLHELWDRCNAIVWEDLKERFDKVNASRACYLHKKIVALTQGISPMSVYFSKLRELWDEYETLAPPPSCGCPESVKHAEHYQLQKLYKFLTGLNESYENTKDQILMTRPLPNINQAYAVMVNVESKRRIGNCGINASIGVDGNDATALLSSRGNNNGNNSGGHTRDNYYKLHGYPADFKYRKKEALQILMLTMCVQTSHISNTSPPAPVQFFTSEQYNQILQISQMGTAGIPTALMSNLGDHNWIVDTGATNHMVHQLGLLHKFKELSQMSKNKVHLPTGEQVTIIETGESHIFQDKTIGEVLYIPEFKYNLLSVSKITKELQCCAAFFPDFCVFQELSSGKVIGIGRKKDGLYIL
ncbi:hypothetical protein A4A49_57131, partial [Nicotiana attenuata]